MLDSAFIRKVDFLKWLANIVMVRKSPTKWRMYEGYTDLNKACPKDLYPLPDLNRTMDATTKHKLLRFMDAFSGYNQIKMYRPNEEKNGFCDRPRMHCYKVMPFGLKNAGVTF